MKSMSSLTSISSKTDQGSMAGAKGNSMTAATGGLAVAAVNPMTGSVTGGMAGVAGGGVYSPRNIVKANNAQVYIDSSSVTIASRTVFSLIYKQHQQLRWVTFKYHQLTFV